MTSPAVSAPLVATPQAIRGIDVVLTAACNLSCSYCYQNRKRRSGMSWDTLRAAVDLLARSEQEKLTLNFFGGEPLLQFGLIKRAVAYAEQVFPPDRRVEYGISTNGTLLDEEKTEFLDRSGFEVQLSFDGVAGAQDRRRRESFVVLDALVDRLRRQHSALFRERLSISITLTAANLPLLADSVDYFLSKAIQELNISPVVTHEPVWNDQLEEELDRQFSRIHQSSLAHYRATGEVPVTLFRKLPGRQAERSDGGAICSAGRGDALTVDVNGDLRGCVLFCESYQALPTDFLRQRLAPLGLGNVGEAGFERRLAAYPGIARTGGLFHHKDDKYSNYGRCADCGYVDSCTVCPVSIGHLPGNRDPDRIPDWQCAFNTVAGKWRERFPRLPTAADILTGRAPTPRRVQELLHAAAGITRTGS